MSKSQFFLLYLNDQTYLGEEGERLAEELRKVRAANGNVRVLMVHENDDTRGGCDFGTFFDGRTPVDLLQARAGVYCNPAFSVSLTMS